jgi:hypothetical protein
MRGRAEPDSPPSTGLSERTHDASERAALRLGLLRADNLRGRVYRYLCARGFRGATDNEIIVALGMKGSTERPRRIELWRMGLIEDSGLRRDGCTVWRVVKL